jgi:hypothetical protein
MPTVEPTCSLAHCRTCCHLSRIHLCSAEPSVEPSSSDEDDSSGEDASSAAAGGVHASSSVGSNLDDMQPPPGVSWKKSKAKKKQVGLSGIRLYLCEGMWLHLVCPGRRARQRGSR